MSRWQTSKYKRCRYPVYYLEKLFGRERDLRNSVVCCRLVNRNVLFVPFPYFPLSMVPFPSEFGSKPRVSGRDWEKKFDSGSKTHPVSEHWILLKIKITIIYHLTTSSGKTYRRMTARTLPISPVFISRPTEEKRCSIKISNKSANLVPTVVFDPTMLV
jgi:hypothetical protein